MWLLHYDRPGSPAIEHDEILLKKTLSKEIVIDQRNVKKAIYLVRFEYLLVSTLPSDTFLLASGPEFHHQPKHAT